jgi:thiol-disulfide isomerase/thioredoxin
VIGGIGAVTLIIALAVALGGSFGGAPPEPGGAADRGTPAPAVPFERFDGTSATLAAYSGRPLVVNFWASWCPSCVAEMSTAFRPAQETYGPEVAFLGLNLRDDRDAALALVADTGVAFDLAEDRSGDLFAALGGLGMPFTVLVDADGTVVHRHNGSVTEAQLAGLIEETLLS